ncbi:MAG: hypothetical protein U0Z17_03705 [Bacteroidales bacterium]
MPKQQEPHHAFLQNISYTEFNKADTITQKTTVTQQTLTYAITYGPDQQRVKLFIQILRATKPCATIPARTKGFYGNGH